MIVALNNKSNLEKQEFENYIQELNRIKTNELLILCPTFLNIGMGNDSLVPLGSQNVSTKGNGAYTGEISAEQLKSYGVKYSIIGHSERREYQNETLEEIHEKCKRLLENDIIPILCVGETLQERKDHTVEQVLEREIKTAIEGLTEEEKQKIIVAYEPVWSIGTGVIPTNSEIEEVFRFIKTILPQTPILYGGSANEENIDTLKEISLIDGYLLGGLSLKIEKLKIFLEKLQ